MVNHFYYILNVFIYICMFLLMIHRVQLTLTSESTHSAHRPRCARRTSAYKLLSIPLGNYNKRERQCQEIGGNMATPNTLQENELLKDLMVSLGLNKTYIGCSDRLEEANLVCSGHVPGTKLFTNWADGESTKSGDCVMIHREDGKWHGAPCRLEEKELLCEIPGPMQVSGTCDPIHPSVMGSGPKCLRNHVIREVGLKSRTRCCTECQRLPGCNSINVMKNGCQLNNATVAQIDSAKYFVVHENCKYYELSINC